MGFEINCNVKPGDISGPNPKDKKWILNSFAGQKIVPCCACLYSLSSAGFSRSGPEELCSSKWLAKGPFRAFSSFPCGNLLNRELLSLVSLICRTCISTGGGRAGLSVRGSDWLQQISGIQLLPSSPKLASRVGACSPCIPPPPKSHSLSWWGLDTVFQSLQTVLKFLSGSFLGGIGKSPAAIYITQDSGRVLTPLPPERFGLGQVCSCLTISGTCTSQAFCLNLSKLWGMSRSTTTPTLCIQKCRTGLGSCGGSTQKSQPAGSWVPCRRASCCPLPHTPHALVHIHAHSQTYSLTLFCVLTGSLVQVWQQVDKAASYSATILDSFFFSF